MGRVSEVSSILDEFFRKICAKLNPLSDCQIRSLGICSGAQPGVAAVRGVNLAVESSVRWSVVRAQLEAEAIKTER